MALWQPGEVLMRAVRICPIGLGMLLMLSPDARADNLAGLVKGLFDIATVNRTAAGQPGGVHEPHFIVGESLKLATREFNQSLVLQLSSFPLGSSSGGFTYTVNPDTGEVLPTSSTFGPAYAERALTIGRGKVNIGFSFQARSYDSFEGADLGSGQLSFIREHNDCCPPRDSFGNVANLNPEFERDLLQSDLSIAIDSQVSAFFANVGLSDRFDVGIAVPFVRVEMDATVNARIFRTASGANPLIHSFDGSGGSQVTHSASGSANGLGDILVRAKYNFFRSSATALAAALDLRLPTGDKDNLLGTGATQTQLFFVASGEYGVVTPHVNFGYTFSRGENVRGGRLVRSRSVDVPARFRAAAECRAGPEHRSVRARRNQLRRRPRGRRHAARDARLRRPRANAARRTQVRTAGQHLPEPRTRGAAVGVVPGGRRVLGAGSVEQPQPAPRHRERKVQHRGDVPAEPQPAVPDDRQRAQAQGHAGRGIRLRVLRIAAGWPIERCPRCAIAVRTWSVAIASPPIVPAAGRHAATRSERSA